MDYEEIKKRVLKARMQMIISSPFFGSLVLRLNVVMMPNITDTMATDGVYLVYHPDFIQSITNSDLEAVICHEVLHCALLHHLRIGKRDKEKWNVACDYVVNLIIKDETTYKLPNSALIDDQYKGKSAEQIYTMLPDKDQLGKEITDSGNYGRVDKYSGKGDDKGDGSCDKSKEQEGIDGLKESMASSYDKSIKEQETIWKSNIASAVIAGKVAGKGSAGLFRRMEDLLEPQFPWSVIMSSYMTEMCRDDFSWDKPDRRLIYLDIYLPEQETTTLGDIVIMIDTSGSITNEMLMMFASELVSILHSYPATTITVMYIDYSVTKVEEVTISELKFNAMGGGGTSFVPGYVYLEENGIYPNLVLYFTDGECDSYPEEPSYETLWVCTQGNFNPPFGKVIEFNMGDK